MRGVPKLEDLPPMDLPEIAFAGRSNVGKSSLINALLGRKLLARVSNTPGRTQELNFFNLGDRMVLVDMPGYGYAKASKKSIASWQRLIRAYVAGRANLQRVCVLIDSRHGVKDNDHEFLKLLDQAAVSTLIILTKTDKLKKAALEEVLNATRSAIKKHPSCLPEPILTSSETGDGLEEARAAIAASC